MVSAYSFEHFHKLLTRTLFFSALRRRQTIQSLDIPSINTHRCRHQLSSVVLGIFVCCGAIQAPALAGLALIRTWKAAPVLLQNVEFSPNGAKLLSTSGGGIAQLWSLDGKSWAKMEGQRPPMFNGHFNNRGSQILTSGYDGSAWLWDQAGNLIRKYMLHKAAVTDVRFVGNDGNFVSSSDDGQVILRNAQGEALWSGIFPGTARQLAVSVKGDLIASSSDNGLLHLIRVSNDGSTIKVSTIETPHGRMNQLSISNDSTRIAASGIDGTVTVWDSSGNLKFRLKVTKKGWVGGGVFCKTPQGPLLTVGADGLIQAWSMAGHRLARLRLSSSSRLTKVDCDPIGRIAAVVGSQGELWLVDISLSINRTVVNPRS